MHKYRIFDLAIVDVVGTFGIAWIVSKVLGMSYLTACVVSFLAGIVAHRIYNVRTTVDTLLF